MKKIQNQEKINYPSYEEFNKIGDLRPYLLDHPDGEMIKQACLHFLGDEFVHFNETKHCFYVLYRYDSKLYFDVEEGMWWGGLLDSCKLASKEEAIEVFNGLSDPSNIVIKKYLATDLKLIL